MYKFNVEIKLDTEEKLESDFIEGLAELLNDEVGDICKVSVKQDTKWQKLKDYLKNQISDLKHIDIKTETQRLRINDGVNCFRQVIQKMQELEAEDAED